MMEVHVFWTSEISGTPAESDEMSPRWFELKNVPFHQMWPDDQIWWPYFLRNQKFQAYFLYDHLQEKLMRHEIAVDS
ncbi:hypothetical protein M514_07618 [Trichuris suis]|uniref:Nudix hydrolase domain-containing protein n=1 Tax=Trichuris suis TaxID=68888 RepID=A0A085N823_9BILA|nr:hypothetical protein M513_07618 [Trichuris suis]KFD65619.1 hypothetical protein M514_07618 [Trichuris suis]